MLNDLREQKEKNITQPPKPPSAISLPRHSTGPAGDVGQTGPTPPARRVSPIIGDSIPRLQSHGNACEQAVDRDVTWRARAHAAASAAAHSAAPPDADPRAVCARGGNGTYS
ncbi:hypothetical protein EVAR_44747_1 [Eumeta japonica]|uniref:Uncharacterized protein n=1 Tax=Eumeta variegata TaxID=151549 RepID=A0A4C1XJQ4_EUMVA|nr:hypothetical protein EVAR_44747_1 [Eumeta japonica]